MFLLSNNWIMSQTYSTGNSTFSANCSVLEFPVNNGINASMSSTESPLQVIYVSLLKKLTPHHFLLQRNNHLL